MLSRIDFLVGHEVDLQPYIVMITIDYKSLVLVYAILFLPRSTGHQPFRSIRLLSMHPLRRMPSSARVRSVAG